MSKQILRYTISVFFILLINNLWGQIEEKAKTQKDSIHIIAKDTLKNSLVYGIRLGIDISRPIIQSVQKETIGLEIIADYRIAENWYIASEIGYESEPTEEERLSFYTKGSYTKVGFNYNAYENFPGMNNEVYVGLRYGFSSLQQELLSYDIQDYSNYFEDTHVTPNTLYKNLNAHWIGLHIGLKVETLPHLFLSTSIQIKKLISDKEPDNFENLYIPGFGQRLLNNKAVGFNYSISYLIPLKKK